MNFRWIALIALWTVLAGPIFAGPSRPGKTSDRGASVKAHAAAPAGFAVKP
jgi:hypothetical protein